MSEYVFLYRGGERPSSVEQGQQVMQRWIDWLNDLAAKGKLVDRGQPLEPAGKLVQGASKTVIDGPFAEAKDLVGGYTLIRADDLTEAAELAKGCPILERSGHVEVRPVMNMNL